jgi:hypothetical protein
MEARAARRAVVPEEITAILTSPHALDQYFSSYVPTAQALAALTHIHG